MEELSRLNEPGFGPNASGLDSGNLDDSTVGIFSGICKHLSDNSVDVDLRYMTDAAELEGNDACCRISGTLIAAARVVLVNSHTFFTVGVFAESWPELPLNLSAYIYLMAKSGRTFRGYSRQQDGRYVSRSHNPNTHHRRNQRKTRGEVETR